MCNALTHNPPFHCPRFTRHLVVSTLPTSPLSESSNVQVLWKELIGKWVTRAKLGLRPGGSCLLLKSEERM